jgi:hypothetical protein
MNILSPVATLIAKKRYETVHSTGVPDGMSLFGFASANMGHGVDVSMSSAYRAA